MTNMAFKPVHSLAIPLDVFTPSKNENLLFGGVDCVAVVEPREPNRMELVQGMVRG